MFGRWLLGGTRLLLLDEPTRGVDVGARAELYQVVRPLAAEGVGVLLVSSEVPEVLGLADRVLVMREGRVIREGRAGEMDETRRARHDHGGITPGGRTGMSETETAAPVAAGRRAAHARPPAARAAGGGVSGGPVEAQPRSCGRLWWPS